MFINKILLFSNPFFNAYYQSDLFGKLIFISLIVASMVSWSLILYKFWLTKQAQKSVQNFQKKFNSNLKDPFSIPLTNSKSMDSCANLYSILKRNFVEIHNTQSKISTADLALVESQLASGIAKESEELEGNLFILSTIVSLGPFLGLLGTVWGILITFSELNTGSSVSNNQAILGGISLALATTVLGLLDAIPALIGYNYLKNAARSIQTELECFSSEMMAAVIVYFKKHDALSE